jgi:Trypsin-co-occurring domain 2
MLGRPSRRASKTRRQLPARCGKPKTISRFGSCWRCGRYGEMMPAGGVYWLGNGDGEFPSLADTIAAVRRELSSAQEAGQEQAVQFRTGPVELEFDVAVTRTRGGQAGVQIWVLTLGGKLEREHATTQRIKVTLQPVNPETGEDARIADARQRREPTGPPP